MADRAEPGDLQGRAASATATAEPARVFISYASPDAAAAGALVESLERHGITCWIAPRDVKAGALYADAIVRAISAARALVLVLSENAIGSSHVGKEVERASSKKRPIIALRIDSAPLTPALEYFLSESQWIESQAQSKESAYVRLIEAIRELERTAPGIDPAMTPSTGRALAPTPKGRPMRILVAAALIIIATTLAVLWAGRFWPTKHATAEQPPAAATPGVPTIAVLPFADMSPNQDQGYFSDGLSAELADRLGQVPGLRVIGRTSAFSFKGKNDDLRTIGRALGVEHLLEGSVRKVGDQLRITAQLVDSNGTHVWSKTYDRKLGDVFAIQDEVAKSVAAALSVTLNPGDIRGAKGGTHNLEAYDAYLAGRALASSGLDDDVRHGLEQVERAVTLDPGFALAWSWLALNYQGQTLLPERNGVEWSAKALRATARALELAPDLPSVLAAAAQMSMQHKDWIEAERLTQKVLARATGSENIGAEPGAFFLNVGRPREAAEHFRRAKVAEPVLAGYAGSLAVTYEMTGDLDQAATELMRSTPAVVDRYFIDANLLMLAMARRDRTQIEKLVAGFPAEDVIDRAMQARLDDPPAALAELRRLSEDPGVSSFIVWQSVEAYWAAYFGDPAFALRLLHNVRTDPSLTFMIWRPILKDMRRLPAFKDLVRDLGLVTYWRASGNWGDFCRPLAQDDFECK